MMQVIAGTVSLLDKFNLKLKLLCLDFDFSDI